jgi:hypothetical protein
MRLKASESAVIAGQFVRAIIITSMLVAEKERNISAKQYIVYTGLEIKEAQLP